MSTLKNTINLGLQIVPKSKTMDSYALVDKAIEVIQESGIKHLVTPFETVMEGPEDQLFEIARKAKDAVLEAGADEVLVYYRIQIRKNAGVNIEDKIGKYSPK
ncbi:thiamine-binding protein [Shivajiella indica]|uniref:MTH1187 family thiamine-binding protein n=1 Tax=Shivajiella indica TaxID=872115 RepID=A0ABW5B6K3_9BACT